MEAAPYLAILTQDELIAITGYKRKSLQAKWLKAHKVKFVLNAFGQPVVGRWYFESYTGATSRKALTQPNWAAQKGYVPDEK